MDKNDWRLLVVLQVLLYMNLSYESYSNEALSDLIPKREVKYLIIDCDSKEQIGYVEGYLTPENHLISVVNIFDHYKRQGIGTTAFVKVFEELGGPANINGIMGSWHSGDEFAHLPDGKSTNLKLFLQLIEKGMTKEDAAKMTPTGKWSNALGFRNVKVNVVTDYEAYVLFF
jgi:hypothetical protein